MIIAVDLKTHATIAKYSDDQVKEAVMDVRAKGYSVEATEALKDGNILMWVQKRWNR